MRASILTAIKSWIPLSIRRRIGDWFYPIVHSVQQGQHWLRILVGGYPAPKQISISYGYPVIPRWGEPTYGGLVKFQRMQDVFPNSPYRFNVLYLGSSTPPPDWEQQLWLAKQKRAKIIINQNGVGYPGWHGPGWEKINEPMAKMLQAADYVFYQSQFCKLCADKFLGQPKGSWEILHNAVDTQFFIPASSNPDPHHLVLLLGGKQYQFYRVETAIRTVAALARDRNDVRLIVAGRLSWIPDEQKAADIVQQLVVELGLTDKVTFCGPYKQENAPAVLQQAHLLLHTKYNDPCPGLVVEAMACGLPIVYSQSGGVSELVGDAAGIGIPAPLSWEEDCPADPNALAEAVLKVAERLPAYAEAARKRAMEKLDLAPWIERHREVFKQLLG